MKDSANLCEHPGGSETAYIRLWKHELLMFEQRKIIQKLIVLVCVLAVALIAVIIRGGGYLMGYSYNADERETNINFSDANDEATIYTASGPTLTKLERLCREYPEVYKRTAAETTENGRLIAGRYSVANKRLIRFGKPASAAQIDAAKKNAIKMHSTLKTAPQSGQI